MCLKCGTFHDSVEQQFQFTEPTKCRNPQCSKGRAIFLHLILSYLLSSHLILSNKSSFLDYFPLILQISSFFFYSLFLLYLFILTFHHSSLSVFTPSFYSFLIVSKPIISYTIGSYYLIDEKQFISLVV